MNAHTRPDYFALACDLAGASTPRPSSPRSGAAGRDQQPPAGSARPLLVGTRPMGSTRDYDDLVEALGAYDRSCRAHRLDAWERLTVAADRCGRPAGEPPMTWARGRVAVYQQQQRGGF